MQVQGLAAGVNSTRTSAQRTSSICRRTVKAGLPLYGKQRIAYPSCQRTFSQRRPRPLVVLAADTPGASSEDVSGTRQLDSSAVDRKTQPSTSDSVPAAQPETSSSREGTGETSPFVQQYPIVSEGRRSSSWGHKQGADKRPLWGTFIKVMLSSAPAEFAPATFRLI